MAPIQQVLRHTDDGDIEYKQGEGVLRRVVMDSERWEENIEGYFSMIEQTEAVFFHLNVDKYGFNICRHVRWIVEGYWFIQKYVTSPTLVSVQLARAYVCRREVERAPE